MKKKAYVVTTAKRGVFFGYGSGVVDAKNRTRLSNVRMCQYWHQNVKGVLGLAASGPTKECRIGPSVPSIELLAVTAVIEATPEAIEAWEKSPWML